MLKSVSSILTMRIMKYRLWDREMFKANPLVVYHGNAPHMGFGFARQVRGSGRYCVRFSLDTTSPIQGVEYHFDARDDVEARREALEIVAQCAVDGAHDVKSAMYRLTDYRSMELSRTDVIESFNLAHESVRARMMDRVSAALDQKALDETEERLAEENRAREERRAQWEKLSEEFGKK